MGSTKTLSIVLISFFSFFINVQAATFYAGPSYSFAGVVSKNDFYNGSTDWTPGVVLGAKMGMFSMEAFLREFTLKNEHEDAGGAIFNLETKDLLYGAGIRLELLPKMDFILGVNTQNVSTKYEVDSAGRVLDNPIDNHFFSWYLGGGYHIDISENFFAHIDAIYYKGSFDFSLFAVDFVFLYKIISL